MKKSLLVLACVIMSSPCAAQTFQTQRDNVLKENSGSSIYRPANPPVLDSYRSQIDPKPSYGYTPPPLRSLGNVDERREDRGLTITKPVYPSKPNMYRSIQDE